MCMYSLSYLTSVAWTKNPEYTMYDMTSIIPRKRAYFGKSTRTARPYVVYGTVRTRMIPQEHTTDPGIA